MLEKLVKIANTLDQKGLHNEADMIDSVLQEVAKTTLRSAQQDWREIEWYSTKTLVLNRHYDSGAYTTRQKALDNPGEVLRDILMSAYHNGVSPHEVGSKDDGGGRVVQSDRVVPVVGGVYGILSGLPTDALEPVEVIQVEDDGDSVFCRYVDAELAEKFGIWQVSTMSLEPLTANEGEEG